jgi:hypothetical protein
MTKFGCSFPGCDRHPSKGDTILRISAKGGPFVGRCAEHYGHEDGQRLAEGYEAEVARRLAGEDT